MAESRIDFKEIEKNLYDSFQSFFKFSIDLIGELDKNKDNYKFAVVNMQIALELFLKYYFIRKGLSKYVIDKINVNGIKYKDFSMVLSNYFRVNTWSYGRKKELTKILQIRNNIVHSGTNTQWNKDAVGYIIRCIFFIHGIMNSEFDEMLISDNKFKLKNNELWTESVEEFIDDLVIMHENFSFPIRTCFSCGKYTVIPKEIFDMGQPTSSVVDDLVCLNCLEVYQMEFACTIIDCYECVDGSYFVDLLNPQAQQLYVGKCSECGTDTLVRKCSECEKLYHPSEEQEIRFRDKFSCSEECAELHKEGWNLK